MYLFSTLNKISKKNRKIVLTISSIIILSAVEFSVEFIGKEASILSELQKTVASNTIKVAKLENDVERYNEDFQSIVTRLSFNAYIEHTDDRFKGLNETNRKLLSSMGIIDGRVSGVEKIIYALNMYELRDSSNKRK